MTTVGAGSWVKVLMILIGVGLMAASFLESLVVRVGAGRPRRPATRTQRAIFFLVGFAAAAEGIRLLFS
jgi:hypothetical protein